MAKDITYFDNINNTQIDPDVLHIATEVMKNNLGNPSSHVHTAGVEAGKIVEKARVQVAGLIKAKPESVIFTSGATESNNLAVTGFIEAHPDYNIIVSNIEHFSIVNQARKLKIRGTDVYIVEVENSGILKLAELDEALSHGKALVSIAIANPEIGVIQEIKKISEMCHSKGSILHCDATAAAGFIDIDVTELGVDLLTMSAHNMHGPTGVGALYIDNNLTIAPLFDGGNQEFGIRPGTENLSGVAGFGKACELAQAELPDRQRHLNAIGDELWKQITEKIPFVEFTGHQHNRLPGHVSFWVRHIEGESLLLLLSMNGIMVSSGSACSSNLKAKDEEELAASHVLSAIGVPSDICAGSITFSSSKYNTMEDVNHVMDVLPGLVERLLAMSPSYEDYIKDKETSDE
jgi:cysteine desulfurase